MSDAPIIVIGAPGSGGGAAAAALAAGTGAAPLAWDAIADQPFGDVAMLRKVLHDVLAREDADWTCPPAAVSLDQGELDLLREQLERPGTVVHDICLPFVLPAVSECSPVRLVVLVVEHEVAVRRTVAATGLRAGDADAVVRAYHERLATIVDRTGAAVFDATGATPADLAERIAARAGIRFDREAAETIDRPATVEVTGYHFSEPVERLRAATVGGDAVPTVDLTSLAGDWEAPGLDPTVGVRAATRRHVLRALVLQHVDGEVVEVTSAAGAGRWHAAFDDRVTIAPGLGLHQVAAALAGPPARLGAVLFPDLLSWASRAEVRVVLEHAAHAVRDGGTVAIAGSPAIGESRRRLGRERLVPPELHALARQVGMIPHVPWDEDGLTVVRLVVQSSSSAELQRLRAENERLARTAELRSREALEADQRLDSLRERIVTFQDRIEARDSELARLRSELGAAPQATTTITSSPGQDARVRELEQALVAEQQRFARLRSRRTVRAALRAAAVARPVVRVARRIRRVVRG